MAMNRTRIGLAALAVTTLGATFAAGVAVGRDDTPPPREVAGPGRLPLVVEGPLQRVGTCAELLDYYVENTIDQVTPYGWVDMHIYYAEDGGLDRGDAMPMSPPAIAPGPADGRAVEQGSSETGTNVQEAGVDEPDVVKTNGRILVRIDGDDLATYDVSGKQVRKLSEIDLPGKSDVRAELLLVGDQALVFSQAWPDYRWNGGTEVSTVVRRVDLSDPAEPEIVSTQEYDASLLSARQYGETVRLVLSTGLPQLDFVQPDGDRSEREALRRNRAIVRDSVIGDWLPSVTEDGDDRLAVGCDAMSVPEDFSGGGSVSVIGYDLEGGRDAMGVATSSDLVYSSSDRLYLATGQAWARCCWDMRAPTWPGDGSADGTTDLHAFALDGTAATYLGSGEVEGSIRDRWSMDAVDGTLRVAVGPTSETGNFNSVVTLREKDGRLDEVGRVDRLGVDEEIKSVRWFDDLAVVVTFRQTDPLYAVDLTDPARPKTLGKLKIPGFSEYLHPIGDDLMIGIGTDATLRGMTRGGQAAVFDLTDLTSPKQVAKVSYGQSRTTMAGQDPRQFTWLPGKRTALTVVSQYGSTGGATGWISVLEVGARGGLENTMLRTTYGYADIADLRTVPLPDGRVVLVSEDTARFLSW